MVWDDLRDRLTPDEWRAVGEWQAASNWAIAPRSFAQQQAAHDDLARIPLRRSERHTPTELAERVAALRLPTPRSVRYAHPAANALLIAPTLVLPASWLSRTARARRTRRMRLRKGLCLWYGYDLRATLNHCPACGHVPDR